MTQAHAINDARKDPGIAANDGGAPQNISDCGQIVLVLQGGGALGAYQAGVYQALHEAGIEPDWVIGTSIGAINASLIAGNKPENRLARLDEFWSRVGHKPALEAIAGLPWLGRALPNWMTLTSGIPSFFRPNPFAFLGLHAPLSADAAGYYSTGPLEATLTDLVDFSLVQSGPTRLTVGAANAQTSEMRYFDSRDTKLTARHVMASGALPPAFPAVRIDGELFWDGGILSNTPVEAVFDDTPRRNSLVFAVHIWNPSGPEPETIWQVLNRQKDIQYSSRAVSHIKRQKQIHRLRHIIAELAMRLPERERDTNLVREMAGYGCLTRIHVVRLVAPPLEGEDHTKDIDFSRAGIRCRWAAGYEDTRRVLADAPWEGEVNPIEGFYLHECRPATAPMK
ncbi:patatin-like phospholipase family protein [Methylocapsa aurea]|uniref:patatin-like phospholipase family protein n=1 Tax=Methylocapsa aurea TaxID=663610 RepID=UPI0009FD5171|nr:patatin-like phospholipase family protein [Methylocapsa aurea]